MNAYGVYGDANSVGDANEICPSIQGGQCCGEQDQKIIMRTWKRDRERQQNHHSTVLRSLRWIVGFHNEFKYLAVKVIDAYRKEKDDQDNEVQGQSKDKKMYSYISPNDVCYKAANYVEDHRLSDNESSMVFYNEINKRVQFLENTRRGFFCIICSLEGQRAIWTTWRIFNIFYSRRVYYAKEFCDDIAAHTEPLTYTLYKNYTVYLRRVIEMLSCISKPSANKKEQDKGN